MQDERVIAPLLALVVYAPFITGSSPEDPPSSGLLAPVDFATEIRPILSDRCFQCHGPDAGSVAADLRLDDRESAIDDLARFPAAIVPGDSAGSELMARVTHGSERRVMPPPKSKLSLTADEVALLARWIDEGAEYTEHWSFTPPVRHQPEGSDAASAWARDPLDLFVHASLEGADITPAEEASRATWLRRASLDLTGLPPTPADLDAFVADEAPDAYERKVDELLTGQRHAEHMASSWMDVARYADTFGYQADQNMNVWPWRDWVLDAFENNLPYDDFVTWQLAGDLIPEPTRASALATAFNRLHRQTNEGGSVEEEYRVESVCDRVETMAGAFLGLTVGCARCHDHKFDPISQRDYFGLFAFFDDIDESGIYSHFTNAVPTPALGLPTDDQAAELTRLEARVRELEAVELGTLTSGEDVEHSPSLFVDFESPPAKESPSYELQANPIKVDRNGGSALQLSGENAVAFPGAGVFERSDPFTVGLRMLVPDDAQVLGRAVVIHRTKSWTDSGSRGYQLLIEDGHLTVSLVHFWPGDAIAIRSLQPVVPNEWSHVAFTYDGSSRASGLELFIDGAPAATEVIRDHLTRTIRGGSIGHLAIGSRFRDKGFRGGMVDDVFVGDFVATPESLRQAADGGMPPSVLRHQGLADHLEALQTARAERDALRDQVRQVMTMQASPDLAAAQHVAYVLERGEYTNRGEEVEPSTLSALPTLSEHAPETRLDLARWLTHPDHPLTTRVQVDRLWRTAFGKGLIATPEDLGSQSLRPVHLELLDTLARDFVDSGWDSRAMLRRFVLSSTYRQSSRASDASGQADPDGALLSRAARTRMSAEVVRDSVLFAAGLLHEERGGPSVYPYQPPGLWQEKRSITYPTGRGTSLVRRSLYTFWRRTSPPPTMTMFDAPSREACTVARSTTSTPLQTLALWNDPQFVAASVALGACATDVGGDDLDRRVDYLFRALMTRDPSTVERSAMVELLRAQREAFELAPEDAYALAGFDLEQAAHPADEPTAEQVPDLLAIDIAATAVVASTLFSFEDVSYRR